MNIHNQKISARAVSEDAVIDYYSQAKKLLIVLLGELDVTGRRRGVETLTLSLHGFKGNEQMIELLNMVLAELQDTGGGADG